MHVDELGSVRFELGGVSDESMGRKGWVMHHDKLQTVHLAEPLPRTASPVGVVVVSEDLEEFLVRVDLADSGLVQLHGPALEGNA